SLAGRAVDQRLTNHQSTLYVAGQSASPPAPRQRPDDERPGGRARSSLGPPALRDHPGPAAARYEPAPRDTHALAPTRPLPARPGGPTDLRTAGRVGRAAPGGRPPGLPRAADRRAGKAARGPEKQAHRAAERPGGAGPRPAGRAAAGRLGPG